MTITLVASQGQDATNTNRGTSIAVPFIGVPTGGEVRMALLTATAGPSGVGGTFTGPTPGSGWAVVGEWSGGLANDGGSHAFDPHTIKVWRKFLNGTETGNVTVGIATGFTGLAVTMDVFQTDQASFEEPIAVNGQSLVHANSRTAVMGAAIALAAGDAVYMVHGGCRSGTPVPSAVSVTQTGATFTGAAPLSSQKNTAGSDGFALTGWATVSVGSTDVPTIGYTMAFAMDGPSALIRMRGSNVVPDPPKIITLTGIPAPSPAVGTGTTVTVGAVDLSPAGIMSVVNFGAMVMEQGIGVQLTGIPAPSPAVSPNMAVFREGEQPQEIVLTGIPAPSPAISSAMHITQGEQFEGPPCEWPIVSCGEYPAEASGAVISRMERAAVELLYMRSGQQFGNCPVTIRPCQACNGGSYEEWPVLADGGWAGSWVPYLWAGAWTNLPAGCACVGAHTCHPPEIRLPQGASSITEVKVDGVTLDPSAYRVDDGVFLVRQDGGVWPTTQDLAAPAGGAGTFTITYQPGLPVPLLGKIAAGALALEFVKACVGAPCRLPAGVQSLVRQGVEIQLVNEDDTSWLTGVKEADDFLNTYNPKRLRQRPVIYSLDVQEPRQTTWSSL